MNAEEENNTTSSRLLTAPRIIAGILLILGFMVASLPYAQVQLQLYLQRQDNVTILFDSKSELTSLPARHRFFLEEQPDSPEFHNNYKALGWSIWRSRTLYWQMQGVSNSSALGYDVQGLKIIQIGNGKSKPTIIRIYFYPKDPSQAQEMKNSKRIDYFEISFDDASDHVKEGSVSNNPPVKFDKVFK